ncbi:MAG: GDP-mannose 4,6-dehydratase [Gammaproteobacteria bacterium]
MSENAQQRLLITGANGFVGSHLIKAFLASFPEDAECIGWGLEGFGDADARVSWDKVDLRDAESVDEAVLKAKPTVVVHLAAISHVPTSYANPELVWDVNLLGTLRLLEAIQRHTPDAVVLVISSSEVYGRSFSSGIALDEQALLAPRNPYAVSKSAADLLAGQYAETGMQVLRLRPFNHVGPRQSADFVVSAFASQIARIEKGLQEPVINVGNLDAQRDFLHVKDVVSAYLEIIKNAGSLTPGEVFNVCSGIPRAIGGILQDLLALSSVPISVQQDESRMRPSDTPLAVGSAELLKSRLNWNPVIPWETTLLDTLEYWRSTTAA